MAALVEHSIHQKEQNFKQVFEDLYQTLCVFASGFLKDDVQAADVVQEIFIKLWEHQGAADQTFNAKSYLYTAVRHQCLNILRDRKEVAEDLTFFESTPFYEDVIIEKESYRIFYNAVDSLPPQTRRIIYMSIDGLKNADIAAQLSVTEANVHRLKKLAYKKLKTLLKEYYYLLFLFLPPE